MISNILFDNVNEKNSNPKYQEVQTDKIDFELTERSKQMDGPNRRGKTPKTTGQ